MSWQYDRIIESIEHAGQRFPDRYLKIHYEDLVSSPEDELAKISTDIESHTETMR